MTEPHPPEPSSWHPLPEERFETPPAPRRSRRRRVLRGIGIALAALLGLVVLAVVVALVWLHTQGGAATLGRIVTREAANSIQGQLRVGRIEVRGFLNICVDGVDLRDPDGHEVLRAERACVHVNPIALRAHKILLSDVQLVRPWIQTATVEAPDGKPTTTLARALAPRKPPEPKQQSGPFAWSIDVSGASIQDGSFAMLPAPDERATLGLDRLQLSDGRAHYSADASSARLQVNARLTQPGRAPVALRLDAKLDGSTESGKLALTELRAELGKSGFVLSGSYDLGARSGEVRVRDLRLLPDDLEVFEKSRPGPLVGEVRGQVDARIAGRTVQATARLDAGSGQVRLDAQADLDAGPRWNVALQIDHLDPGAVARTAPHGTMTARVEARGTGVPQFDAHGIRGDLQAKAHLGPARFERVGDAKFDLEADLRGRNALVRAFTFTAFGISAAVHGEASYDALALDVNARAPDLSAVGRAIGAFQKGPSAPLAGSVFLTAHVTGSPRRPNAQLHVRAPLVRDGTRLFASRFAVDGRLDGSLRAPDGRLSIRADELRLGEIPLQAPRIRAQLAWPMAHLQVTSAVEQGGVELAGDARIDDDKDGLALSNFVVSYPGNRMQLAHEVRVHFREGDTVVEPLDLVGEHGSLRLAADLTPRRIDATLGVKSFDLSRLPQFAMPADLGLRGVVDADVAVKGARSQPDLDLKASVRGGAMARTVDLPVDADAHARIHAGRVSTDGLVRAPDGLELTFALEAPMRSPTAAPTSPLRADVRLARVDLGRVAARLHLDSAQKSGLTGTVQARLLAAGTLAAPNATLSIQARGVGTSRIHDVGLDAGLVVDKGRAALDGVVTLSGEPTVSLSAQTALDLLRAVREPTYLAGAQERAVDANLAVAALPLDRLARAGALPQGSSGNVGLALHLSGTPAAPRLTVSARGESIVAGRVSGLSFQSQLSLDQKLQLTAAAQTNGASVARADANLALSGAELVTLVRRRKDLAAVEPLLDRPVSLTMDVPGLVIGRMAQLAGRESIPAEGQLEAHLSVAGSPAKPRVQGRVAVRDILSNRTRIGNAELSLDATASGATATIDVDPPGGGTFRGHAKLDADLGARALLRDGVRSVLRGELSADVAAKKLDLAFLSGLAPRVRRTAGTLDADVKVSGLLGRPIPEGKAHLEHGQFDLVGEGVFQEVLLDATFSPKEVVVDRFAGTTGGGTFAAILVGTRKEGADIASDRIDFTGEIHLGDDESVKGRRTASGAPIEKGAVPLRQAGEERARVSGEVDFFGDYTGSVLTIDAKIPTADVKVLKLPDKKLPSLSPNPDILLVHGNEKPHPPGKEPDEVAQEAKARAESKFRLNATLNIEHVYVSAEDFEFPVETQPSLTFVYNPRLLEPATAHGTIHVPNGSFSALGRRFVIEDAKITETGGDIGNPELDIKARYDNPQAVVTVTISGTAKSPKIDLSSNPPMDQDAIAFFLATGRIQGQATQNGGGIDLEGAATSVLGSLLFGQVRNALKDILPVDVLTVETEGGAPSQASVGKYIGDRIYIGYRQRLTPAPAENNTEGRLEYEINRSLAAEATIGDKTKDVSILWTHNF